MNNLAILIFCVVVVYLVYLSQLNSAPPSKDTSGVAQPSHLLYDVLNQYSSGNKISLEGACEVNLYVKYTIDVSQKKLFTELLNQIFKATYNITDQLFKVQEINNIYEQRDSLGNTRHIIDATLHSMNNHYTVKVILDVVDLNQELYINYISVNPASNTNVVKRYDIVYQHTGILLNENNFSENVRSLLDDTYRSQDALIAVDARQMDSKNYKLEEVLTVSNVLRNYFPANFSKASQDNYDSKGITGYLEMYLTPDQPTVESPSYCEQLDGQRCIVYHNSTATEYTQPYMTPGLFYDRSSYPLDVVIP